MVGSLQIDSNLASKFSRSVNSSKPGVSSPERLRLSGTLKSTVNTQETKKKQEIRDCHSSYKVYYLFSFAIAITGI